jgi:hypothetical protein
MELTGVVKNGRIVLSASVHLPEGAPVRVIVEELVSDDQRPLERREISESSVLEDITWATGHRF